ncbi:MAG TPA: UDP-N-acetylmuramoyl-L-alanine--D-glutamate ligase [Gemmatimonadaceae bacterium]|jgi:UDP-N-acetylmuramoylalanine--D-glutamate ligase|nr:UDP-N-acetylmuramoyl-L-alanine--D-glutamate ligase [Gemmatimonadaceae bacterium]
MTPRELVPRESEIAVIGLARSGRAVAMLLRKHGYKVYASDVASSPDTGRCAEELRARGVAVDIGRHDLERLAHAGLVVTSPGVPPSARPLAFAREKGIHIASEVEVALNFLTGPSIIAVTGTNGKTTTTALIAHLLRGLDVEAVEAGNIGTPLSEIADREQQPKWVSLEMSSFQLHDTPSLKPTVGVLTNLSPDHLDRYATVEEYYADKARFFAKADGNSAWVVNEDDEAVARMARDVAGHKYGFSVVKDAEGCVDAKTGKLVVLGAPLLARRDLPLLGQHNVANALAASLAVMAADRSHQTQKARKGIARALTTFRSLPHRLELVGEFDGVQWINDSKATNVSSAQVAIDGMERPTVLLLGGRHKGEAYKSLADAVRRNVKRVIAYGEAAPIIATDLRPVVDVVRLGSDFDEVIRAARAAASAGEAVLLSPACSSYDMFSNYEERGERFRALAAKEA